jgi:hypothetical protein
MVKTLSGFRRLLGVTGLDFYAIHRELEALLALRAPALEFLYDILGRLQEFPLVEDLFTRLAHDLLRQTRHRLKNLQAEGI